MTSIVAERPALTAPVPAPASVRHVPVGPLDVFDGDLGAAAEFLLARIRSGAGARVATANLDFVALARRDAVLREDLAASTLVVADGAPVAWLARAAGAERAARVTGVDLVLELCRRGTTDGLRVAFYGSTPEKAEVAARYLETAFPGVRVVSRISPPFRPPTAAELAGQRATLAAARPDLVLVALGCPKQERFIAENSDVAPSAAWIGVGGTLDFFSGDKHRAPAALQRAGFEWAFRLVQDPRRLWRRYLLRDLPALMAVAPGILIRRALRRRSRLDVPGPMAVD
ncbi:MAG: WecB/TagA/CpsF family glycosyltransferase [Dehalococcoidia bacterium]